MLCSLLFLFCWLSLAGHSSSSIEVHSLALPGNSPLGTQAAALRIIAGSPRQPSSGHSSSSTKHLDLVCLPFGAGLLASLPGLFPTPVFDLSCLRYANMEGEGQGDLIICGDTKLTEGTHMGGGGECPTVSIPILHRPFLVSQTVLMLPCKCSGLKASDRQYKGLVGHPSPCVHPLST